MRECRGVRLTAPIPLVELGVGCFREVRVYWVIVRADRLCGVYPRPESASCYKSDRYPMRRSSVGLLKRTIKNIDAMLIAMQSIDVSWSIKRAKAMKSVFAVFANDNGNFYMAQGTFACWKYWKWLYFKERSFSVCHLEKVNYIIRYKITIFNDIASTFLHGIDVIHGLLKIVNKIAPCCCNDFEIKLRKNRGSYWKFTDQYGFALWTCTFWDIGCWINSCMDPTISFN